MSIFGSIMSKIFSHPAAAPAPSAPSASSDSAPAAAPVPSAVAPAAVPDGVPAAPTTASPVAATAPAPPVDVAAVLTGMASKNPEALHWQTSIVDLLKLLDLDSSLKSRTDLAHELSYAGDTSDSASMNIWLHKAVMTKLGENGGRVPDDLKA
ncbi:DUF3597 domain-containing protein [Lichenicoccus sp.]|uniref:DUF3597 domain-containing protein n=1 Tax=Lichenicoccus sp. TaxID=2781899 RepID=UPI003D0FB536